MNTSQLLCALHCDPLLSTTIQGVYATDQLPEYVHRGGFIANTDISSKSGRHWCAFYFDGTGQSEFFDSYGKPAHYYNNTFVRCLHNNSIVQLYNSKKLQSNYSNVCGQYCLYFLIHRVRGQRLRDIVETLQNTEHRDQYVYEYISRTFPYCITSNNTQYNQICFSLNKTL